MNQYYVYGLFRPDNGLIFYVGMGKEQRAWSHTRHRKRGRSHKDNIICKMIDDLGYSDIPVVLFRESLDKEDAFNLEIALIYAIGRHPHGPLVNISKGGTGRTGAPLPMHTRNRMSITQLKRYEDPLEREKTKNAIKLTRGTEESRIKSSRQMKAQHEDLNSNFNLKLKSIETIEKRIAGIRASRKQPGWSQKASAAASKMWSRLLLWWTDGINEIRSEICPDGWRRGRCSHSNFRTKEDS